MTLCASTIATSATLGSPTTTVAAAPASVTRRLSFRSTVMAPGLDASAAPALAQSARAATNRV
jgi:hypothetical protein